MRHILDPVHVGLRRSSAVLVIASVVLAQPLVGAQTHAPGEADQGATHDGPVAVEGVDYVVYGRTGAASSLGEIVEAVRESEVLLVGEEHDDMPGHAVELALLRDVIEASAVSDAGRTVVLSLEMFERDVQYILDEYLDDLITESHFLRSARPWDDYEARYRPLVETAKTYGAPVIAANAPRRYVNRVTRDGPESLGELSDRAKAHLPPLPYPGPSEGYRAEWDALMAEAMREMQEAAATSTAGEAPPETDDAAPSEHQSVEDAEPDAPASETTESGPDHSERSNAIYSQALWDASMGHAITTALVDHLGSLVVHFAGSFHVARGTGIPERMEDYRPGTRSTTVVITKVDDIEAWSDEDHAGLADFVVLTPKPKEAPSAGG